MANEPEDIDVLRGLAARLRALAMTEPRIADRLRRIADAAEDHADTVLAPQRRPRAS